MDAGRRGHRRRQVSGGLNVGLGKLGVLRLGLGLEGSTDSFSSDDSAVRRVLTGCPSPADSAVSEGAIRASLDPSATKESPKATKTTAGK